MLFELERRQQDNANLSNKQVYAKVMLQHFERTAIDRMNGHKHPLELKIEDMATGKASGQRGESFLKNELI